jgi:hypothetical protein
VALTAYEVRSGGLEDPDPRRLSASVSLNKQFVVVAVVASVFVPFVIFVFSTRERFGQRAGLPPEAREQIL